MLAGTVSADDPIGDAYRGKNRLAGSSCGPRGYFDYTFPTGLCTLASTCETGTFEFSGDCGKDSSYVCCRDPRREEYMLRSYKRNIEVQQDPVQRSFPCQFDVGAMNGLCSVENDEKIDFMAKRVKYPTSAVKCVKGNGRINFGMPCTFCCFGGLNAVDLEKNFARGFDVDAQQLRFDCERHMAGSFSEFRDWFASYASKVPLKGRFSTDQFKGVSIDFLRGFAKFLGVDLPEPKPFTMMSDLSAALVEQPDSFLQQLYATAARRVTASLELYWGPIHKDIFLNKMIADIRREAKASWALRFLQDSNTNNDRADILKVSQVMRIMSDRNPTSLKNYFYGHRSYAALGPMILNDPKERAKFLTFVEHLSKTTFTARETDAEVARIIRYYKQVPREYPANSADISKVVSAMEGNPYMAAWALVWISQRNTRSRALKGATSWLQQPIELDIYIPPHLAQRIHRGEKIDWAKMINSEVKVGHGKTLTMLSELFRAKYSEGCEVTESREISKFIELGTWLRVINTALEYIVSDDNVRNNRLSVLDPAFISSARAKTSRFNTLLQIDLQLILDIKCQFENGAPIDDFVRALNSEYGVVIAGIGSFYKLPKLTSLQMAAKTEIQRPPVSYHWFFSPKNLEKGLLEGRMPAGSSALVTASSLIKHIGGKKSGCIYARNAEALDTLRRLKTTHRLDLGIWTQESQLTRDAAQFLFNLANAEPSLFNLGFAVGGPHDISEWPLVSKCSDTGGLADFEYIPNR